MNNRVCILRKSLNLSQEAFGNRLGVTGATISRLEKGERSITEQMIIAICREFNVSRAWFVEGVGEMFTNLPETILDELAMQYELTDSERELVADFVSLPKEQRAILMNFLRKTM